MEDTQKATAPTGSTKISQEVGSAETASDPSQTGGTPVRGITRGRRSRIGRAGRSNATSFGRGSYSKRKRENSQERTDADDNAASSSTVSRSEPPARLRQTIGARGAYRKRVKHSIATPDAEAALPEVQVPPRGEHKRPVETVPPPKATRTSELEAPKPTIKDSLPKMPDSTDTTSGGSTKDTGSTGGRKDREGTAESESTQSETSTRGRSRSGYN